MLYHADFSPPTGHNELDFTDQSGIISALKDLARSVRCAGCLVSIDLSSCTHVP